MPGAVRRRGGAPAAVVAGTLGAVAPGVPQLGAPELTVTEIALEPEPVPRRKYRLTGGVQPRSRSASKSYASTSAK